MAITSIEWDGGVNDTMGSVSTNHNSPDLELTTTTSVFIRESNLAGKEEEKEKERKRKTDDNKYEARTSGSGAAVPFGPSVVTLLLRYLPRSLGGRRRADEGTYAGNTFNHP